MKEIVWATALTSILLSAGSAMADTFAGTIDLPQGMHVVPGEPLPVEIRGLLSNAASSNGGLAYFRLDLMISGPQAVNLGNTLQLAPPADGSMDTFARPLGYDGDYGGTAVGNALVQAGGAQNVIGNDPSVGPGSPAAPLIVFGVAHSEQVLLEGTITFPPDTAPGAYTLSVENVVAHALAPGQAPMPYAVYRLEPTTASGDSAVIEVLCLAAMDCCDIDSNDIRDDACTWCACETGSCNNVGIDFADMGGAFGACPPDGFVNLFDRNHALTCFAGTNTCDQVNIDAGGAFGSCVPDGYCNLFDANHAFTAFAGTNSCTCSGGGLGPEGEGGGLGLPEGGGAAGEGGGAPESSQTASLDVIAEQGTITPGSSVNVRVFVSDALTALQGYQLHVGVSGGTAGTLTLTGITIESRSDWAFDGQAGVSSAFNVSNAQMLAMLGGSGVATAADDYLATFTFQASQDAAGAFVVDVLHDSQSGDQTFLTESFTAPIDVIGTMCSSEFESFIESKKSTGDCSSGRLA